MIVDRTKEILTKYNVMPKKEYGQNYIINRNILEKIIKSADINENDQVIEIGPGLGSLTEYLCINAKKVLCYEIDPLMVNILKDTLAPYDNVKIIEGDFLKQNVLKDIQENFDLSGNIKVVANLPYYITTPIIFRLLELKNVYSATFMIQKEVGDRFVGGVGTKEYSALTIFMQYYTDTKKDFIVGKNNFFPIPNVDSVVITSVFNKKNLGIMYEAKFLSFIRAIFMQRRKTMVNNIVNTYNLPKEALENKLIEIGFNPQIRSEGLTLLELSKIYKELFEKEKGNES